MRLWGGLFSLVFMPRAGSLVLSAADTLASVWEETTKLKDNEEIQNKPASTIVNIYN